MARRLDSRRWMLLNVPLAAVLLSVAGCLLVALPSHYEDYSGYWQTPDAAMVEHDVEVPARIGIRRY
jgi:hypothetical protein